MRNKHKCATSMLLIKVLRLHGINGYLKCNSSISLFVSRSSRFSYTKTFDTFLFDRKVGPVSPGRENMRNKAAISCMTIKNIDLGTRLPLYLK